GNEDAGAGECVGGGDEGAEVGSGFCGGVAEEADDGGVGGDAAVALGDDGGAVLDGLCEVGGAVEAVDGDGESVAGGKVCGGGGAHGAVANGARGGAALHAGERLADVEAEGGVERERAVVEGGLDEPDAGSMLRSGAVEHGLHEEAADAAVLCCGVDGDGADAVDDGALVDAVAAENAVVVFSDDAVEAGGGEEHAHEADGEFGAGEVGREVVRGADGGEGVEADLAGGGGVGERGGADSDGHRGCKVTGRV